MENLSKKSESQKKLNQNIFPRNKYYINSSPNKTNLNTINNFNTSNTLKSTISYVDNFKGFYFRKFDLTSYKKEREDSRSRSRSLEKKVTPHKIRGNGIPKEISPRMIFFRKIYKDPKFKKYYKNRPKRKHTTINELLEYIIKYSKKKHSILDALMLGYYWVCHEIKYDTHFKERNIEFKESQTAEEVYSSGYALSLGFCNIMETIFKKLCIKYVHIEGYCKLLKKEDNYMYSTFNNSSVMTSTNKSKFSGNLGKIFDILNEDDISDYINHCWDSFFYKGEWYLLDALLGSNSFYSENENNLNNINNSEINDSNMQLLNMNNPQNLDDKDDEFNPFYLMAIPSMLINTHLPAVDFWQLNDKTINLKTFINKKLIDCGKFYKALYKYEVELVTQDFPYIQLCIKDSLTIKIKLKDYVLEANLFNATDEVKISEIKYSYDQENSIFTLDPIFTKTGEYLIKINLRSVNSTDLLYRSLFDYRIKVYNNVRFSYFEKYKTKNILSHDNEKNNDILPKIHNNFDRGGLYNTSYSTQPKIITDYNSIFPSKSNKLICYDDKDFYLIEPKSIYLKKGINVKFKVKIKGANSASILDGNKWSTLKKTEENVFVGQKKIETDNVSICCLRSKGVFTEVFKFKFKKEKYNKAKSSDMRSRIKKLIMKENS